MFLDHESKKISNLIVKIKQKNSVRDRNFDLNKNLNNQKNKK